MGGLSYLAREATRHAPLLFGLTAGVTALLAAAALIARRRG
jgi:nitrate reductase gamma subunit